jgi:hypothetical protein
MQVSLEAINETILSAKQQALVNIPWNLLFSNKLRWQHRVADCAVRRTTGRMFPEVALKVHNAEVKSKAQSDILGTCGC